MSSDWCGTGVLWQVVSLTVKQGGANCCTRLPVQCLIPFYCFMIHSHLITAHHGRYKQSGLVLCLISERAAGLRCYQSVMCTLTQPLLCDDSYVSARSTPNESLYRASATQTHSRSYLTHYPWVQLQLCVAVISLYSVCQWRLWPQSPGNNTTLRTHR